MLPPLEHSHRRGAALQFSPISTPNILRVPLRPDQTQRSRPPNTNLVPGEPLCEPSNTHLAGPPAPMPAVIKSLVRTTLLGGTTVDALELHATTEVAGELPANPPPESFATPTDRPAALARWIARLAAAGVDARRIASPKLLDQLQACVDHPADTLIVSLFDTEAHLPISTAILQTAGPEIAAAAELLSSLCGATRTLLIVGPRRKSRSLTALEPLVRTGRARLVEVSGEYPLSDPTVLLHTLIRRSLHPGQLPTEQGVVLLDAIAAAAVGRLALRAQPTLTVPLAVRNHVQRRSFLLSVPIGTPIAEVCTQLEVPCDLAVLRAGELLRQLPVPPDAVVAHGESVIHISAADRPIAPDPCIRCGWCIDACPTGVHPAFVLEAAQRNDRLLAESFGLSACIECGICSYVCPSRLPLLGAIRTFTRA